MYNILPSNKGVHSEAIFVGILYLWEYFISVNLIFVGAFYPQGLDYCLGCSYLIQLQLPLFPDFSNLAALPASLTPPLFFDLNIHLNIVSACLQNYKSKLKKLRNSIYCCYPLHQFGDEVCVRTICCCKTLFHSFHIECQ